jgi:hypothetical protein
VPGVAVELQIVYVVEVAGAVRLIVALAEEPLSVAAVRVAVSLVETVPARREGAVVLELATVTEAGVVRAVLLSEMVTTVPPVAAVRSIRRCKWWRPA